MIVRLWMSSPPVATSPERPIPEVALEMARRRIRRMLVVDAGREDRLLGIVSLHDVARTFPPDVNPLSVGDWREVPPRPIAEIMTRNPITTTADASIEQVAASMLEHKIGALPVVRGLSVIGLITESDVFRAFVTMTGGEDAGARVTFEPGHGEDAFGTVAAIASRHGVRVTSFLSMHHQGKRLVSVRLVGGRGDALVDDLWRSGHRVVSVEHVSGQRR